MVCDEDKRLFLLILLLTYWRPTNFQKSSRREGIFKNCNFLLSVSFTSSKTKIFSFPLHSRSPCESKYSPLRQNFALSYFSFRLKYFYSRKIFLSFLLLFPCLTHIASSEFLLKKKSGTMFPTNWKYVKVLKSGLTFLYQATEVTKPRVRKRPLSLMMA